MAEKHPFFVKLQNSFWLHKFGVILFFVSVATSFLFGYTDLQIFGQFSNKLHFDISLNTLLVSLFITLFSNKKGETKTIKDIKNTSIKLGFMGIITVIIHWSIPARTIK